MFRKGVPSDLLLFVRFAKTCQNFRSEICENLLLDLGCLDHARSQAFFLREIIGLFFRIREDRKCIISDLIPSIFPLVALRSKLVPNSDLKFNLITKFVVHLLRPVPQPIQLLQPALRFIEQACSNVRQNVWQFSFCNERSC